jgi:hypothetical protein
MSQVLAALNLNLQAARRRGQRGIAYAADADLQCVRA